jgi:hypothetical protein
LLIGRAARLDLSVVVHEFGQSGVAERLYDAIPSHSDRFGGAAVVLVIATDSAGGTQA